MKYLLVVLVIAVFGLSADIAGADAGPTIQRIERMPRPARLGAYERAIAERSVADTERTELTRAFAKHVSFVSPLYGRGKFPFDTDGWITILRQGFETDPRDPDIAQALAQLLIDRGDHEGALPVAKVFRETHRKNHAARSYLAWCESPKPTATRPKPTELLTFPVHFCVITKNPEAHRMATLHQCRRECDILNATFRTLDGMPLVRFEFKGFAPYQEIKNAQCKLVSLLDGTEPYDTDRVAEAFNACTDSRVRDPHAINFYIFDGHSTEAGFADATSHGKRNSNRPYLLIDWQRLNNTNQSPEPHEMGHAFGLGHVGVPGAARNSSTNIMASAAEQFGSGGRRDLGFTPCQAAVILYHATRTQDALRQTDRPK